MRRSTDFRRGFTLKELLIVVGIIALLISILMPILWKARRRALVLTCPIVYVDAGQRTVHLTDINGAVDLQVFEAAEGRKIYEVRWSPSGQHIAILVDSNRPFKWTVEYDLIVLDPASGRSRVCRNATQSSDGFAGWIDDSHIGVHCDGWGVVNVDTGALQKIEERDTRYYIIRCSPAPAQSDGHLLTWGSRWGGGGRVHTVALAKKNYSLGKIVWQEVLKDGTNNDSYPSIDPMGEWVAWNHMVTVGTGYTTIVIKHVKAPAHAPPEVLKAGYQWMPRFCDWTHDGKLLVIDRHASFTGLLLLDRTGKVVQTIPTERKPGRAHYRHYMHR